MDSDANQDKNVQSVLISPMTPVVPRVDPERQKLIDNDPYIRAVRILDSLYLRKRQGNKVSKVSLEERDPGQYGLFWVINDTPVRYGLPVIENQTDVEAIKELVFIFNHQKE